MEMPTLSEDEKTYFKKAMTDAQLASQVVQHFVNHLSQKYSLGPMHFLDEEGNIKMREETPLHAVPSPEGREAHE